MSINKCNKKGSVIWNLTHFILFMKVYYDYHGASPDYLLHHEIRNYI